MADEDETLPWDSTFNESWRNAVNGWEWRSIGGDDWEKSGKCPRCDHGIDVTKQGSYSLAPPAEDVLETIVEAERGPLLTEAEQFFARCNCGEKHEGRPPNISRGCGQWAEIDPPPNR
jgi:hypothetical protein